MQAVEPPASASFSLSSFSASSQEMATRAPSGVRRRGSFSLAGLTMSCVSAAASAVSAPRLRGLSGSLRARTGCPSTRRTRMPVPEGQSLLMVRIYVLSPRGTRGIQPQFWDQYTASYRVFQIMGDATRPTVPPAANLRNPLLFMISSLARLGATCGRRSRRYSHWSPGSGGWGWRGSARSPT